MKSRAAAFSNEAAKWLRKITIFTQVKILWQAALFCIIFLKLFFQRDRASMGNGRQHRGREIRRRNNEKRQKLILELDLAGDVANPGERRIR